MPWMSASGGPLPRRTWARGMCCGSLGGGVSLYRSAHQRRQSGRRGAYGGSRGSSSNDRQRQGRVAPPGSGQAPPVDALHADGGLRGSRDPDHHPWRRVLRLGRARQQVPRRARRAVLREHRPRPRRRRPGRRRPGEGARLLHELVLRAPEGDRARGARRRARPRRPQPRLLHLRRLRGGRLRAQALPPVPQADRQPRALQGHLAQARLPRHHHGRADRDRHPGRPAPVRAAVPGLGARAEHERLPARGRRPGRGDLRADPVRGAGDRLVRDPRAGAELGRLLHAPRRLLPARAGDLRRVRDRLHLRRGDLQLGPPRHLLRRREVRLPAGHHHDGQGHHVLLRPDGRGDRLRPHLRAVQQARQLVHARDHVRRPPGRLGGRARQPRRVRQRGDHRERRRARAGVRRHARLAARHPDRRRRARHRLLPLDRAGAQPGDQGDDHRRRGGVAAARLPLPRDVQARADLPRRRPR